MLMIFGDQETKERGGLQNQLRTYITMYQQVHKVGCKLSNISTYKEVLSISQQKEKYNPKVLHFS